jgi:pathogenesis-related protein 1
VEAATGTDAAGPADAAADAPADASSMDAAAAEPAALAGITAAHNSARATVLVGPMTWDPALAATAQAWADTCTDVQAPAGVLDSNPNRSNGHPWYVGETMFSSSGPVTPTAAVSQWMAQGADYDYAANTCAVGKSCAYYTQVVWAASTHLGCGIASCPLLSFPNVIVCNYGPGGNPLGARPY